MRSETANPSGSITLAHVPRKGLVRMCHSGCIHLTYGCVTLDFHCRQFFDALLEAVTEADRDSGEPIRVRHGQALLCYSPDEFLEFAQLVTDAGRELHQLDAVRRLLQDEAPRSAHP